MSKAKNIARAINGNPFRNETLPRLCRYFICANCHQTLIKAHGVKEGEYYYHKECPKVFIPL